MKRFNQIFGMIVLGMFLIIIGANGILYYQNNSGSGRPYLVEINRLVYTIQEKGLESVDLSRCQYVTGIEKTADASPEFYHADHDYVVREIDGVLYRMDYIVPEGKQEKTVWLVNGILLVMSLFVITVMIWIRHKILLPFDTMKNVPYELSRGNLSVPLKESKSRFFGKFVWGLDLLRESIESQKRRELDLQKEKKTLVLSISHDIKTPLSAIKLYAKALSKGIYTDPEKQFSITESINAKADEIEGYVSCLIKASREDFLNLEVHNGEFYLSELVQRISAYYTEKLALVSIDFTVEAYLDCLLRGDVDRSVEVLQNIMENAIKYGDGHRIDIRFAQEEGCQLITVRNSGCTLPETELVHIFDSFWQGSNTDGKHGSGLGLYICRQLMNKMDGEIFANIEEDCMRMTAVWQQA